MSRRDKYNRILIENLKNKHEEITDIGLLWCFLQGAKEIDIYNIKELYKIINNVQEDNSLAIEEILKALKNWIEEGKRL